MIYQETIDKCFRCGAPGHRSYQCTAPQDKVEQHKMDFIKQKPPKVDYNNSKNLSVSNIDTPASNTATTSIVNGNVLRKDYLVLYTMKNDT